MPDGGNSTLSSTTTELDLLLTTGLPPVDEPTEAALRDAAHDHATALVYTWLNRDLAAQEAFLDQILTLHDSSVGVMLAVDALTTARLCGLQPGTIREDATITLRWRPTQLVEDPDRYAMCVAIIADLWTGIATSDLARSSRARAELYELPLPELRDVLRFMAYDVSRAIEFHSILNATGADAWERYRTANPPDNPAGRPEPTA